MLIQLFQRGLEELLLVAVLLELTQVLVGQHGSLTATGEAHQVALLDEVGLLDGLYLRHLFALGAELGLILDLNKFLNILDKCTHISICSIIPSILSRIP